VPAAAAILVLAEPMVRLVYQRGEFDAAQTEVVATALYWFAFSLPFNGIFLLLTRTFFSMRRPWLPTTIAGLNLLVTAGASFALYRPYGVAGIVASTALATLASVAAQCVLLRRPLAGLELGRLVSTGLRVGLASAVLAAVSYGVWSVLDEELGRSLPAQIGALGVALGLGGLAYVAAAWAMRVGELSQVARLVRSR